MKNKISITLDKAVLKEIESLVDGIRIRNKSQAIEFLLRKSISERRTAVILAGGPEEKLKVNSVFKPLVKVGNKTVMERMLENLRKYKFLDVFVVGRKNILSEIFKTIGDGSGFGVNIQYVEEKEEKHVTKQDTARTLKLLKDKIKKTFLCLYCDMIFDYNLESFWAFHIKNNDIATCLLKTVEQPEKWSVVALHGNKIVDYVEKPKKAESYLVFAGLFVAEPELLTQQGSSLEYEVLPSLAAKGLLSGFVASGRSEHVHRKI